MPNVMAPLIGRPPTEPILIDERHAADHNKRNKKIVTTIKKG
jgi:hypothetical protein